ncbi:MAG TPA: alpha/beta fold hydrolase [Paracoccaceae bacterium]|nr:alpha/beta fold hydrolase [Paracoccaceae bacterium]
MAATGRLRSFLDGIEAWQRHPHRRAMPEPSVLWQEGGARLLDFGGDGPAIVAIPSLINRAYILDLGPETSLMRFLARSGLRALLLDWGLPGPAESGFDLTAYYDLRLAPALAAAQSLGRPLALLGYCMGGALAVAAAQLQGPRIARIALIGTPWSFAGGTGSALMLRGLAREYGLDRAAHYFMGLDQAFGAVPYDFIQLLFALLDPGLALAKFRRFAALDPASAAARRFVEVEDWLNDAVPLTGPAAVEMLLDWQVRNLTGAGEWRLAGQRIRPETLRLPALAFCSAIDRIAPPEATEALPRAIPGARILRPGTGHVGMIVGRRARSQVWDPLRDFLAGA